jgi:peptidoglycan/LPS O-acetylase OafA/YrhL
VAPDRFRIDIHALRGFAVLSVIGAHVLSAFEWPSESWMLDRRLWALVLQNSTIFFVFIAGYLFQHLSHDFSYTRHLTRRFLYVIVPYLVMSVPALVYFTTVAQREPLPSPDFYDQPVAVQALRFILTGDHLAPYWFIPVISFYYVLAPALLRLSESRLAPVVLAVAIGVSCFVFRTDYWSGVAHYFSVYLLGMLASRHRPLLEPHLQHRLTVPILGGVALLLLALEYPALPGTKLYFNYFQKLAICGVVLAAFASPARTLPRWFGYVAHTSFGTYLVHSYLISGTKLIWVRKFGSLPDASIIGLLASIVLTLIGSLAFLAAARRVLGKRSAMMVGV